MAVVAFAIAKPWRFIIELHVVRVMGYFFRLP